MDPAKMRAWQRLREQVLQNPGWPRGLWFTALEDGLCTALGEESRLLADFRRDRAELLLLEQRASGSYHDGQRIEQLEAQISQLVDLADRTVTGSHPDSAEPRPAASRPVVQGAAAPAADMPAVAEAPTLPRRQGWRAPATTLASGMLLVALGIAGASLYYEMRIRAEAGQQMARLDRLLEQRLASWRVELDRRPSVPGDGVSEAADALAGRSEGLRRALDDLGQKVAALQTRLPALGDELERITAGGRQRADDLARAGAEIEALKAATPELTAWLVRQKEELEAGVQSRRDALGGITARVRELDDEVDRSQALLTSFNQSLDQGLQQAKLDGEALKNAVEEMQGTGLAVAKLMDGAEVKVQAAIDQMLSELAEKADLAVLRGQDVIGRAEGEVTRRANTEGKAALDALAEERKAQLAALAEQVAASQVELEQTRAGLIASWQRMDQSVADRQGEVLAGLDGYASTMEARVQEFLKALDVMVARSGG